MAYHTSFAQRLRVLSSTGVWRLVSIVLFAAIPAVTIVVLFWYTIVDGAVAFDFRVYERAAEAILAGESPYPGPNDVLTAEAAPYIYPPFTALLVIPLTWLPFDVAGVALMAALLAAGMATLRVLGVADWRCYGVAVMWPPVLSAVQTGNLTLALGLGAALIWRFRHRALVAGALLGMALAMKLFFWPLAVWLAVTRRVRAAACAVLVAGAGVVVSWAAIGFVGVTDYVDVLRRHGEAVGGDSYTAYIVGLDLGLPSTAARVLWVALGFGVLAMVVRAARHQREREAFILTMVAALALTPIVWLHYFALLLVVVALARPRLGLVWFVPFGLVLTPGSGQPTPFETAWTLGVVVLTVGLALRELRQVDAQHSLEAFAAP